MTDLRERIHKTPVAVPQKEVKLPGRARSVAKHTGLILLTLVMLYPVIWMVASSLRPGDEIFRSPGLIPDGLQLSNYSDGWNALSSPFGHYLINSAIVVLGCIIGNLVSCSMAAYAFARLEFTGKKLWFAIMLGTIMLPIHVIIVPQYVMFSQFGWVNTFLPLIVPKLLATDAFFVFLMVQFIRGLPRELDEAARIDGAADAPGAGHHHDLHLHLDVERLLQPADLPDRPGDVHGAGRAALLCRRHRLHLVGIDVRDERRLAPPDLPRVPRRTAIPDQGHRDDRHQVNPRHQANPPEE
jgi:hypothetical protein